MELRFNKEMYARSALLKAAYHFTDRFYIYLDQTERDFLVNIEAKPGNSDSGIKEEFSNELLAQTTRAIIVEQTQHIRELLLGRAFASTIIDDREAVINESKGDASDDVFSDWYDGQQD